MSAENEDKEDENEDYCSACFDYSAGKEDSLIRELLARQFVYLHSRVILIRKHTDTPHKRKEESTEGRRKVEGKLN